MADNLEQEAMEIFRELKPETQNTLFMYACVARAAENAVKKSIIKALEQKTESKDKFSAI